MCLCVAASGFTLDKHDEWIDYLEDHKGKAHKAFIAAMLLELFPKNFPGAEPPSLYETLQAWAESEQSQNLKFIFYESEFDNSYTYTDLKGMLALKLAYSGK